MPQIIPDRPLSVILEDSLILSMCRRHHDTSALPSEAYPAGNDSGIECYSRQKGRTSHSLKINCSFYLKVLFAKVALFFYPLTINRTLCISINKTDFHLATDIFILKQLQSVCHFNQRHNPQFFRVKLKLTPNSSVQFHLVHNQLDKIIKVTKIKSISSHFWHALMEHQGHHAHVNTP